MPKGEWKLLLINNNINLWKSPMWRCAMSSRIWTEMLPADLHSPDGARLLTFDFEWFNGAHRIKTLEFFRSKTCIIWCMLRVPLIFRARYRPMTPLCDIVCSRIRTLELRKFCVFCARFSMLSSRTSSIIVNVGHGGGWAFILMVLDINHPKALTSDTDQIHQDVL